jgi:flagellar protein FliL
VFKNKLFMIIIAMLIVITLILVAFFAQSSDPSQAAKSSVSSVEGKQLTAAEIKDQTALVEGIVTNLADKGHIIKASFAFEMDTKKGKEEFALVDFKVKGIIIQTLSDLKVEQVQGSKGQELISSMLMNKINTILTTGKVKQISITDFYVD